LDKRIIDKMRRLGLTEQSSTGAETVRLSAQCTAPLFKHDRAQRRAFLDRWRRELDEKLKKHGGEVITDSLSMTAQTVDVRVPVDSLEAAEKEMAEEDIRLDPIVPRQVQHE